MSDEAWKRSEPQPWREPGAKLAASLAFLTRLPISAPQRPMALVAAMPLFPVAGALIGAFTGVLAAFLADGGVAPLLAACLAFAATLCLTGALHEDGLADTADGFGGGTTRERRLELMRDSHIGTYGTLALVAAAIAKVTAIGAIVPALGWCAVLVLAATGAGSRAAMVWLMAKTPPARSDGLSASTGQPDGETLKWTAVTGLMIALLLLWWTVGFLDAAFALLAGAAATLAMQRLALRQIGGQTGDVCGATQVASEIAILAAVTASLP
ncbi:MAG: adenosylcobinamide-GDP ribazoletransferase [Rhizobiales bacterium]|nr:adenosylcobinamide-GDP ribazoletransferase [Hyphomicrobiales bacterium]